MFSKGSIYISMYTYVSFRYQLRSWNLIIYRLCLISSLHVFVLSITVKLFVQNLSFVFVFLFPFLKITDDLQMGCTELRSKRYISDGFCTSIKPITEVVCAGECLPIDNGQLPFYAQYMKVWSREKTREYRCVNDVVRQKRVSLRCDNGEERTYRIRTVRSCKCKKYNKEHNKSQLYDNQQNQNQQSTPRKTKSTEGDRRSRKRKRNRRNRQKRSEDTRTERVK